MENILSEKIFLLNPGNLSEGVSIVYNILEPLENISALSEGGKFCLLYKGTKPVHWSHSFTGYQGDQNRSKERWKNSLCLHRLREKWRSLRWFPLHLS